jgi:hypothetical protein
MVSRSRFIVVCVGTLILSLVPAVEAMALTQGGICSTQGQIRKSGKVEFKCVGTSRLKYWIQLPSVVPAQKFVSKTLAQWSNSTNAINFEPYIKASDVDLAKVDLEKIQVSANYVSQNLSKAQEITNNYKNSATSLTDSAKRYTELAAENKKIYETKLTEFQAAQAKTNAFYSQYQAAQSSRAATISCMVLKDFGLIGSCSSSAYQDALDLQTIRTYNALKTASDSALESFKAASEAWSSALKLASKDLERAQLALDTSELYSLRTSEWENLSSLVARQDEYVNSFLAVSEFGNGLQQELTENKEVALKSVELVKASNKQTYKNRYLAAFAQVEFLKLAEDYYQSKAEETPAYSPIQLSVQEPQIWRPTKYYKGSNYSDIENKSDVDFAWSWSSSSSCEITTSCKKLFIVTSKDCNKASVTLDFMTPAKVSESKTTSREYALKSGEIALIEVEGKFTDTASSAYVRAFKCSA